MVSLLFLYRIFSFTDIPAGKYVGNRPVKLKKADSTAIRPVEIGARKSRQLEVELKKNRKKPY
jgi:hypothetical protein